MPCLLKTEKQKCEFAKFPNALYSAVGLLKIHNNALI